MVAGEFYKQDRVMRLLREQRLFQLAPRGLTTKELADRMGISQRSAQRDIAALESELEMPFVKQGNRYAVLPGFFLASITFSLQEAMALLLSARLMARFADRSNPYAEAAYEKIGTVLPEKVRAAVAEAAAAFGEKRSDDVYVRVFAALTRAWADRRKVRIEYTMERTFTRVVWPLFIEPSLSGHSSYLIAWEEKRQVPRSYRLERISMAEVLDDAFDPPLGFSVGAMLADSWGIWSSDGTAPAEVTLDFAEDVARRVKETLWHPSQRTEDLPDGRVRVRLRVSSLIELRPWVLSWGHSCAVVAPPELRAAVRAEVEQAASHYASDQRPARARHLSAVQSA